MKTCTVFTPIMKLLNSYLSPKAVSIMTDIGDNKIIQAVRQSGKTKYICANAALYSILKPNYTIYIGTIKNSMCSGIRDEIMRLLDCFELDKSFIIKNTINHIQLANGSQIIIRSVTPESVRGMAINVLLLDEFAYVNDNCAKDFINTLIPVLRNTNTKIHIISTRKNRSHRNMFWHLWVSAVEGSEFKPYTISNRDCHWRNNKQARLWKDTIGRAKYDTEFTIRTK